MFTEEAGEEMSEEDDKDDSEPRYRDFFDPPPSCAISSDVTDKRPLTPFEKRQKKVSRVHLITFITCLHNITFKMLPTIDERAD